MEITVGADPELFITNKSGDNQSAYGIIPGTKQKPHPVDGGAVQVDGMALEFNIDPAHSEDEFVNNINTVMAQLRDMVPKEYKFRIMPTANFRPSVMDKQPPAAVELGCDPDFNAYTEAVNPAPPLQPYDKVRCAGGHVHIGWTQGQDVNDTVHFNACAQLVRQLDYMLGVPMLYKCGRSSRTKWYGQPGAFRPKPYGVEYRVLSNKWIRGEDLMRLVYKLSVKSINLLIDGTDLYRKYGGNANEVLHHGDKSAAHWLMSRCVEYEEYLDELKGRKNS